MTERSTRSTYVVKELDHDNVEHLVELAIREQAELGHGRPFDVDAIRWHSERCIADIERNWLNAWILYIGGAPIGFLVATQFMHFASNTRGARQEEWYVVPEHRNLLSAHVLVRDFEEWCRMHECSRVYMGVEHIDNEDMVKRVCRVIEAFGYSRAGAYYAKQGNEL